MLLLLFDYHHDYTAVVPVRRTKTVASELRELDIEAEDRTDAVAAELRDLAIGSETRVKAVPRDSRTKGVS